jgi:F-type H+-transporting ATPase subunit b
MIVVLAIFFFLLVQLNKRLYVPLLRFMDRRDETIARDLKDAGNLSSDSEELFAEAQANLSEAKAKAAQMRQDAIEKCKEENLAAYEKRQAELVAEYERFMSRLDEEREALRGSVLSQLPLIKESLKAKFSKI